ncbi:MAG: hypothetical protein MZU91_06540 [Desulfosudis oleivorans]|nr:hypothetical protein [Desulfosudis oleivorans]
MLNGDRSKHLSHCHNGSDRVCTATFHEIPPGIARHDFLHITAQWMERNALFLAQLNKVLRSRKQNLEADSL